MRVKFDIFLSWECDDSLKNYVSALKHKCNVMIGTEEIASTLGENSTYVGSKTIENKEKGC